MKRCIGYLRKEEDFPDKENLFELNFYATRIHNKRRKGWLLLLLQKNYARFFHSKER